MKQDEIFIAKIKEANLEFMSVLVKSANSFLKKRYPGYKGFIRNAPDGCYELFAETNNPSPMKRTHFKTLP